MQMALKLGQAPPILPLRKAFRNMVRYDAYRIVSKLVASQEYERIAHILKHPEGNARKIAAITTILLQSSREAICSLSSAMGKNGASQELSYCANVSRKLSREFHDDLPSELETIAANLTQPAGYERFKYNEFRHFYRVYRNGY